MAPNQELLLQANDRYKFIFDCIQHLIGEKHIDFTYYTAQWRQPETEIQLLAQLVCDVYQQNACARAKDLKFQIEINDNLKGILQECYETRWDDIVQAITIESIRKSGIPMVENFDWKLKLIMGSSKVASLRKPIVQMDLHCFSKDKNGERETVNFEMDLEQVDAFIKQLEIVQKELKKMSAQ